MCNRRCPCGQTYRQTNKQMDLNAPSPPASIQAAWYMVYSAISSRIVAYIGGSCHIASRLYYEVIQTHHAGRINEKFRESEGEKRVQRINKSLKWRFFFEERDQSFRTGRDTCPQSNRWHVRDGKLSRALESQRMLVSMAGIYCVCLFCGFCIFAWLRNLMWLCFCIL